MSRMSDYPGVTFSVPSKGLVRVQATYRVNGKTIYIDDVVDAINEREAFDKVFGSKEAAVTDPTDQYLEFLRET